jgi:dTDP-L-rhamnose 4-epimerase
VKKPESTGGAGDKEMSGLILITGGAGFVGSHVGDELLNAGYRVRALDNISAQVHGSAERPEYLSDDIELVHSDIRDPIAVRRALEGVTGVIHLAAMVGVGQSMYQLCRYTDVNNLGTAVLLEALIDKPVDRLVVASSMSVYGEGLYLSGRGELVNDASRRLERLKAHQWEICDESLETLSPVPTPETKTPALASIYALSKYDQERMCLITGKAYGISSIALRFFNIYGPRQALSNPYTGVLANFAARYLNSKPPLINEDGHQQRDFVSVHDIARACRLALETPEAAGEVVNIGSGQPRSIRDVARRMGEALNMTHIHPEITQRYRKGDIRHCFADITKARIVLGYEPRVLFEEGLIELAEWLAGQPAVDRIAEAGAELANRGLTV